MTAIGKLLVFLNLFVALALLTWAASLSANRLDWVDRKTETETIKGQVTRLKEQLDAATKSIAQLSDNYGTMDRKLTEAELDRDQRRAEFANRLQEARDGTFREQVLLPDGIRIDIAQKGPTVKGPGGQDLKGVQFYQDELNRAIQDGAVAQKSIADARTKFTELTADIQDTNARIASQRDVLAQQKNERTYLGALQVNWDEQLRTLRLRERQLEQRLQAVEKATRRTAARADAALR